MKMQEILITSTSSALQLATIVGNYREAARSLRKVIPGPRCSYFQSHEETRTITRSVILRIRASSGVYGWSVQIQCMLWSKTVEFLHRRTVIRPAFQQGMKTHLYQYLSPPPPMKNLQNVSHYALSYSTSPTSRHLTSDPVTLGAQCRVKGQEAARETLYKNSLVRPFQKSLRWEGYIPRSWHSNQIVLCQKTSLTKINWDKC